jgi:hypothetical protein
MAETTPALRPSHPAGPKRYLQTGKPTAATGAIVSIIGHITTEELRAELTEVNTANGFGNRFLWPLVRRSKGPSGGTGWICSPSARSGSRLVAMINIAKLFVEADQSKATGRRRRRRLMRLALSARPKGPLQALSGLAGTAGS